VVVRWVQTGLRRRVPLTEVLIGRPLETQALAHQAVRKLVGLAVFASDALSSTAYATEEILLILALAGAGFFHLSLPIAGAIAVLLAIVTISYRQTIFAYPNGGGAYIVARDSLGELVPGTGQLCDRLHPDGRGEISSGVAQITSAFPGLLLRVELALIVIADYHRQPAWRQGKRLDLRRANLFLPGHDVPDTGCRRVSLPHRKS
jgi:hypothetical protein